MRFSLEESARPLTDVRPLSLLGEATVAQLGRELGKPVDARRFRANIVLAGSEPFAEDRLAGYRIAIGEQAVLQIRERTPRCRIITLDPDTASADPLLMRHLARCHDARTGIYAAVEHAGMLRVGDTIRLL